MRLLTTLCPCKEREMAQRAHLLVYDEQAQNGNKMNLYPQPVPSR